MFRKAAYFGTPQQRATYERGHVFAYKLQGQDGGAKYRRLADEFAGLYPEFCQKNQGIFQNPANFVQQFRQEARLYMLEQETFLNSFIDSLPNEFGNDVKWVLKKLIKPAMNNGAFANSLSEISEFLGKEMSAVGITGRLNVVEELMIS